MVKLLIDRSPDPIQLIATDISFKYFLIQKLLILLQKEDQKIFLCYLNLF